MSSENRKINFGAGPAKVPEAVLKKAQEEFFILPGTGISVVELSHRSADFKNIYNTVIALLREQLSIPNEFEILLMHGGATGQFAAVPMNLKTNHEIADYAITGRWSLASAKEASKFINVHEVFRQNESFVSIPENNVWEKTPEAAYLYYCANETINGVEFYQPPETLPGVPLVADVCSNILSRPFSFLNHGVVLGSTQKNLGAAGLTIVIVRKDLIHKNDNIPSILSYYEMHKAESNLNTPNVFGVYLTKLVLEWIRDEGGINEIYNRNQKKAGLIYDMIDTHPNFYCSEVCANCRSLMNIPFRVGGIKGNDELEKKFLAKAAERGMIGLKGHRSVGGIRASLYNAVTMEDVDTLRYFMEDFYENAEATTFS